MSNTTTTTPATAPSKSKGKRRRPSSNNNAAMTTMLTPEQPSTPRLTSVYSSSLDSYLASANGTAIKRIRTPHKHDVLSGRGGGINSHVGNVQFRAWVATRKNDYNLALNKAEKAAVARQVIAMVVNQDPPGRFLTKDPSTGSVGSTGWWIELDDEKVMAKTAQALREGAPAIRAEHADELVEMKREIVEHRRQHQKQVRRSLATTGENHQEVEAPENGITLSDELNKEETAHDSELVYSPSKKVRVEYNGLAVRPTDETPPLLPAQPLLSLADLPPLDDHRVFPLPPPLPKRTSFNGESLKRAHSLAFSEDASAGEWIPEDFVNPFESDEELARLEAIRHSIPSRSGFFSARDSSTGSHGDMGGLSALLSNHNHESSNHNNHNHNNRSTSSSVRSRSSMGNMSSRSLTSVLSDLPDSTTFRPHETDFMEGMKGIYDALHTDENDMFPSFQLPYRGGGYLSNHHHLRRNSSLVSRGLDGRQ